MKADSAFFFVENNCKKSNKILQKCKIMLDTVTKFTYNASIREYKKSKKGKAAYGSG